MFATYMRDFLTKMSSILKEMSCGACSFFQLCLIYPWEIHSIYWRDLQIFIFQAQSQPHLSHGNTLHLLVCSTELYLPNSVTASSVPLKYTPSTGVYVCQAQSQSHLSHGNTLHLLEFSTDLNLPSSVMSHWNTLH
jgi:hypothetical protein